MTLPEVALVAALWTEWVMALVVLLRGVAELRDGPDARRRDVEPRAAYTDLPLRRASATRALPRA